MTKLVLSGEGTELESEPGPAGLNLEHCGSSTSITPPLFQKAGMPEVLSASDLQKP